MAFNSKLLLLCLELLCRLSRVQYFFSVVNILHVYLPGKSKFSAFSECQESIDRSIITRSITRNFCFAHDPNNIILVKIMKIFGQTKISNTIKS